MKKIIGKLRSKAGETLVEGMASILIFTFSSIILLTLVVTAARLNATTRSIDNALTQEMYAAESQNTPLPSTGMLTITYSLDGSEASSFIENIATYSLGDNCLYSFARIRTAPENAG